MTKYHRALPIALMLALEGIFPSSTFAEQKMNALPIRVPFDLTTVNARVDLSMEIAEHRVYQFMIEFARPPGPLGPWSTFIGTGQQHEVRADTADSDHPVVVEQFTPDEQAFLISGGRIVEKKVLESPEGRTKVVDFIARDGTVQQKTFHLPPTKWRYTEAGSGVHIPLRLKVERLKDHATLYEQTLETVGTVDGGTRRAIFSMPLQPGTYAVHVENIAAQPLPAGSNAQLLITYNPKVVPSEE